MELQQQQAKAIVHEINHILPQKINLMNKRGIIIASTDPERVNTFHGGAARLIKEGLDELRIANDQQYAGARAGTNFMLEVKGEPIGVLGLTGNYEDIKPLANIIRKMTELLVQEQEHQRLQTSYKYQQSLFINDMLSQGAAFLTKEQIERGLSLGIDLQHPRRILVAEVIPREPSQQPDQQNLLLQLEDCAKVLDHGCCHTVTGRLMIFLSTLNSTHALKQLAQRLLDCTHAAGWDVYIGIDSPAPDNTRLQDSLHNAQKALHSCHRKGNIHIKCYDEINMEIFADGIPITAKREYVRKIFRDYTPQELAEAVKTLECFFEHDGSIIHTAEALFIHKNTLQQHLRRIARRTGYDPRSLRSSAVFYMVLYFYQDISFDSVYSTLS